MITSGNIIKKIFIWIIINAALSLIIFLFFSVNTDQPLKALFFRIYIMTNLISLPSALIGYTISHFMKRSPIIIEIPVMLCTLLGVAAIIHTICYHLLNNYFNPPLYRSKAMHFVLFLVISGTIIIITMTIEHLRKKKEDLEKNLNNIKAKIINESRHNSISIKTDEGLHVFNFNDLVYLSSHGKRTTLHTEDKDYVINEILKEIENKLPGDKFFRIHKQFVVNMAYINQVKYFEGGRYMAYLKDEDSSALPIGRKNIFILKEKLGI